jgi:hypothetical protein
MADDPDIIIDTLNGNCPVQAEGTIDGHNFYFRARWQHWSIDIGGDDPCDSADFTYREAYGDDPYSAGWMSDDEARAFIAKGAAKFRERD